MLSLPGQFNRRKTAVKAIKNVLLLAYLLALFSTPTPSLAAPLPDESEFQLWVPILLHLPEYKNFYPVLEVQPRMGSEVRSLDQLLIRPWVDYRISEKAWVGVGYNWVTSYSPVKPVLNQNWVWQQAGYRINRDRLRFINRFRVEERFIQNASAMSTRLRYLTRLEYSLFKSRRWSAVLWNEIFVNPYSVKRGPVSGIDQDRIFVGLRRQVSDRSVAEIGYQTTIVNPKQPPIDRLNHALFMRLDIAF